MRFEDDIDAERVKLQKRRSAVQQRLSALNAEQWSPDNKRQRGELLTELEEIDFAQKRLKSAQPSREKELLDLIRRHKAMTLSVGDPGHQDAILWAVLDR